MTRPWMSSPPMSAGGGPSPCQMGNPRFAMGAEGYNMPKRMDEYTKVFEEKTAQTNQGDGSAETGPTWMRWTKLYLIGNAPDAETMLMKAESATREITMQDVANMAAPGSGINLSVDPMVLSGHIWRYLNQATVKTARSVFENLEVRNGMEAWRRLYRMIHKGSLLQKHTLAMRIQSPGSYLKDSGGIAVGIGRWEQDIRDYVAAGGQWPAQDAMIMNLCAALPTALRSNLIWRTNEFDSYQAFKHYIVEQIEKLEHFNGKGAVCFLENEEEEIFNLAQEKLKDYPDLMEALALGRGGPRGKTRPPPKAPFGGAGAGSRLPGTRRDDFKSKVRCVNCGGQHKTSECTKPMVEKNKRPCWTCGKAGCTAATCKSKRPLANIEDDDGDEEMLCVSNWQDVTKRRGPRPAANTVGDYIQKALAKSSSYPVSGSRERSPAPADEPAEAKPTTKIFNSFKQLENSFEVDYDDDDDDAKIQNVAETFNNKYEPQDYDKVRNDRINRDLVQNSNDLMYLIQCTVNRRVPKDVA